MIPKPAIQWINSDSDALFINDSSVVLKALADNITAIFTTRHRPCR